MLIGVSLMVLLVLTLFSLILGNNFISGVINVEIDNEAIVEGLSSTYVVEGVDVIFSIDTTTLINAGIAILITVIAIVLILGFNVLATGLTAEASKIAILITAYVGIWFTISFLAFGLIFSIEAFGSIIYISLTLVYVIGVIKKLSGGND